MTKSIKIPTLGLLLVLVTTLTVSCVKNFEEQANPTTDFTNATLAQVYVATVGATRNYVYVDGKAVTGAALASGSTFPSGAYAFTVPAGLRSFLVRDTLTATTQAPLPFAENLQTAKLYTIFLYDTITSPKQLTVPTEVYIPTGNPVGRLRFANFIYNTSDVPAVDVFSVKQNTNVFTNIPRNQVTGFISFPAAINDTLYIRQTGTTTNIIGVLGFNPTVNRSYTMIYRGSHRGTKVASLVATY